MKGDKTHSIIFDKLIINLFQLATFFTLILTLLQGVSDRITNLYSKLNSTICFTCTWRAIENCVFRQWRTYNIIFLLIFL